MNTSTPVAVNAMEYLQQSFVVPFEYKVFFTEKLFSPANSLFRSFIRQDVHTKSGKFFFVIDQEVALKHSALESEIRAYCSSITEITLIEKILIVPGGEIVKNTTEYVDRIIHAVSEYGIDRHSYIVAIGGGSVLDMTGYASAIAHRGIRHIRIPTTVLSQNDSGVGVKNGINYSGKKNFIGTFAPPVAVFNDFQFLTTLSIEEWRSGMSEAVKVALIKDRDFFVWLEENAIALAERNMPAMQYLVRRCAQLHMLHIAGGDSFEMGSSRPLDFGHWSAHKIEQLSEFTIRHGEAVAMGIAMDSVYSFLTGRLHENDAIRIIDLLLTLGFTVTHELMEVQDGNSHIIKGLNEFREHLGGELTIMLLKEIGRGEEVHEMDVQLLHESGKWLKAYLS